MTQDFNFNPSEFLKRAAEKIGFNRERYIESHIPTDIKNIGVFFFYGDFQSKFLLSSILLKKYVKHYKYSIMCSYSGDSSLYPYVDEYWSCSLKESNPNGFKNISKELSSYEANLLRYFPGDVINFSMFDQYYNKGFTKKFFDEYKDINFYRPSINSPPLDIAKKLSSKSYTLFIHPSKKINININGKKEPIFINFKFWEDLIRQIIPEGITPVLLLDSNSYDLSPIFAEKCIYVTESNTANILGVMRATGCVLDICSGISRMAILARTPYLLVDSRQQYFANKENELDDLFSKNIQKDYVFLFNDSIQNDWQYVNCQVIAKLKKFLPLIDRNKFPSCEEREDVLSYDLIRKKKSKKIGLHFVKVQRDVVI